MLRVGQTAEVTLALCSIMSAQLASCMDSHGCTHCSCWCAAGHLHLAHPTPLLHPQHCALVVWLCVLVAAAACGGVARCMGCSYARSVLRVCWLPCWGRAAVSRARTTKHAATARSLLPSTHVYTRIHPLTCTLCTGSEFGLPLRVIYCSCRLHTGTACCACCCLRSTASAQHCNLGARVGRIAALCGWRSVALPWCSIIPYYYTGEAAGVRAKVGFQVASTRNTVCNSNAPPTRSQASRQTRQPRVLPGNYLRWVQQEPCADHRQNESVEKVENESLVGSHPLSSQKLHR